MACHQYNSSWSLNHWKWEQSMQCWNNSSEYVKSSPIIQFNLEACLQSPPSSRLYRWKSIFQFVRKILCNRKWHRSISQIAGMIFCGPASSHNPWKFLLPLRQCPSIYNFPFSSVCGKHIQVCGLWGNVIGKQQCGELPCWAERLCDICTLTLSILRF